LFPALRIALKYAKTKTSCVNTDDLYLENGTAKDSLAVPLLKVVRQVPCHPYRWRRPCSDDVFRRSSRYYVGRLFPILNHCAFRIPLLRLLLFTLQLFFLCLLCNFFIARSTYCYRNSSACLSVCLFVCNVDVPWAYVLG